MGGDMAASPESFWRRPEWLGRWVEQQLIEPLCDWMAIRRLVREGACQRPVSDAYITRMIRSHLRSWGDHESVLTDVIRKDPGLLEYEICASSTLIWERT